MNKKYDFFLALKNITISIQIGNNLKKTQKKKNK
jgi:hypothetical protein